MKILVLGAGGMAGHVVSLYLREQNYDVSTLSARHPLDHKTALIDVTNVSKLSVYLSNNHFDVVVNCIGLLIRRCEERPDLAVFVNSYLPHFLENNFKYTNTKVIHLSTDCVFSGKAAPYREESICDGDSFYDRTKALGELRNNKDLTFRMSIIGPELRDSGIGLFNWFFKQTSVISGYKTAIWNGITTIELAKGIDAAIKQNLTGLYHLVPEVDISKFSLLELLKEIFCRQDIRIISSSDVILNKTLVNSRRDFKFKVSDYETMVIEMKHWIESHKDIYPHYIKPTDQLSKGNK